MLDKYDEDSKLFLDSLDSKFQKSLFFNMVVYDNAINVIMKYYIDFLYVYLLESGFNEFENLLLLSGGFNIESKDLNFVATNVNCIGEC